MVNVFNDAITHEMSCSMQSSVVVQITQEEPPSSYATLITLKRFTPLRG